MPEKPLEPTAIPRLGVLGGMGPLATADFLKKLIEETPAENDEEHMPVIVYSVPQIPSRPDAIVGHGASPLPAMLEGIRTLRNAGAQAIAIPCNTAHYWAAELERDGGLALIHIADAVRAELERLPLRPKTLGLIATKGTVAAGFFQRVLGTAGYDLVMSSGLEQDQWVLPAIRAVKRNALDCAQPLARQACEALIARGAERIVLACTETPLAIDHRPDEGVAQRCIDATRALAKACVAWWIKRCGRTP